MRTRHLRRDLTHCFDGSSPVGQLGIATADDCWKKNTHLGLLLGPNAYQFIRLCLWLLQTSFALWLPVAARLMVRPWVKVSMWTIWTSWSILDFQQFQSVNQSFDQSIGVQQSFLHPPKKSAHTALAVKACLLGGNQQH